jgi:hypothetical protein
MNAGRSLLAGCLLTSAVAAGAQEGAQINLPGISVIGDQELPKVLYIVPWKETPGPGAMDPPLPIPGDAAFTAVNRDEFLRLLRYQKFVSKP